MTRPPSLVELQRAVADFNGRHAVGDAFWAYKGLRGENPIACVLRTPAELLSGRPHRISADRAPTQLSSVQASVEVQQPIELSNGQASDSQWPNSSADAP